MEALIIPYQERWPRDFEEIKKTLVDGLGSLNIQVEHVGSTSVGGMQAKPIIDIDIVYYETDDFDRIREKLERLGYYHNGDQGIPGREVFKLTGQRDNHILYTIKHHLYVCHLESEELRRHLLFRDHLKQNPEARKAYSEMKLELAKKANQDKEVYVELKEINAKEFINKCIENQRTNGE